MVPSHVPRPLATQEQLEPSIFGVPPLDEFTVEVGSWIWAWVERIWARGDGRLIEIEAKIGVLRDVRSSHHHNGAGPMGGAGERMKMPVAVETILTDASGIHFESNMTERQHKRYNQILNARVEESAQSAYPGSRIKYSHRYEVDEFHNDVPLATPGGGRRKVRVTRDQKSGKIIDNGSICKERVADMNIFSPKRAFDFRISINLEIPGPSLSLGVGRMADDGAAQQPRTGPTHRRFKDRISYSHQLCNVDLTQVRTDNAVRPLSAPSACNR